MANVANIKTKILARMDNMDLESMSLEDLSNYVEVLRRVSDISEKPYMETLLDTMNKGFCADKNASITESAALSLGLTGGGLGV